MPTLRRTNLLLDQNVTFNQPTMAGEELPPHMDELPFGYRCKLCQRFPQQRVQVDQHVGSRYHQSMLVLLKLEENQAFALSNKNDVTVDIHNGTETHTESSVYTFPVGRRQIHTLMVRVRNHNDKTVDLEFCDFVKAGRSSFYKIVKKPERLPVRLRADSKLDVEVSVRVPNVGKFSKSIFFKFSLDGDESFYIVKHLSAVCSDNITKELAPTEPYTPMSRVTIQRRSLEIIPGVKLPEVTDDTLEIVRRLTPFRIKQVFRSAVNHGLAVNRGPNEDAPYIDGNVVSEIEQTRQVLKTSLTFDNYTKSWSTLLRLEKMQADINIQTYNMSFVTMKVCRENKAFMDLEVPGLAENRPSLLRGDVLFVSYAGSSDAEEGSENAKEYEGFVHHVALESVWLGFNTRLMEKTRGKLKDIKWNVRFVVPEHLSRLQERAVTMATENPLLRNVLFPKYPSSSARNASSFSFSGQSSPPPKHVTIPEPPLMHPLNASPRFFNHDVKGNEEQAKAVCHIVSGTSRPAPYLIFGPPGTGKTVTLVEAILQTLDVHRESHIVACAPSNSAADLITERLSALMDKPHKNLFRMHARSRSWLTVPESIKQFSNHRKGNFYYPSKATIQEYRVVVSTLSTAGRLVSAVFPDGHFTHLFVDECGQATEPECVIAMAGLLSFDTETYPKGGQVVLAGDPKQLGPIVHSPFAGKFGLGVSLLERLMRDNTLYQRTRGETTPYNVKFMTELRRNYRSHPAILEVPNRQFYHGDLLYYADQLERSLFCAWPELPKQEFPVIFHGTMGEELREGSSPSFFNPAEISIVMEYIEKIMEHRRPGLKYEDIGIITPYRKQVDKIRKLLRKRDKQLEDIRVGTVEEFQGGEKKVIIVSTVRSNPNYGEFDTKFKLGFVANPKKFNVAITRAMALLIVVGNPFCLKHDEHWCGFIRYCQQNGVLIGVDMDEIKENDDDTADVVLNDVVKEMLQLKIDPSQIRPDTPDLARYWTAPDLRDENVKVVTTLEEFRQCSARVRETGGVVGMDCEWTPAVLRGGGEQTLALLQLAVNDQVFVLDIPELRRHLPAAEWTQFFADFFTNDDVIKVGFGIGNDLSMILTTFRHLNRSKSTSIKDIFHPNSLRKVCDLYVRSLELDKIPEFFLPRDTNGVKIEPGNHDLSELVRKTQGKPLDKGPQLSDWDARPLLRSQLRYAAIDAFVLLAVFAFVSQRLDDLNVTDVDLFKKLNNKFWNKLYGPEGRENE